MRTFYLAVILTFCSLVTTSFSEITNLTEIEELSLEAFEGRRVELAEVLEALCEEKGYDLAALLVTDIRRHESLLLATGEERLVAALDLPSLGPPHRGHLFEARGMVSRKKQLFPMVCDAVGKALAQPEGT